MKVLKKIFEKCMVIEPTVREDLRGSMGIFYNGPDMKEFLGGFEITEQRFYKMPCKTFFGIHKGPGKIITLA